MTLDELKIEAEKLGYTLIKKAEIRDVAKKELQYTPTIAAVEVVRCGECKYSEESPLPYTNLWCNVREFYCKSNWFCADGKRNEE